MKQADIHSWNEIVALLELNPLLLCYLITILTLGRNSSGNGVGLSEQQMAPFWAYQYTQDISRRIDGLLRPYLTAPEQVDRSQGFQSASKRNASQPQRQGYTASSPQSRPALSHRQFHNSSPATSVRSSAMSFVRPRPRSVASHRLTYHSL